MNVKLQVNRNHVLWVVQGLLAALFLFVGGAKLITPVEVLAVMFPFPGEFIRFIGACEVLGAVGLILPWALNIRRELTPLAAAGLVVIMIGAALTTLAIGGGLMALGNVLIALLAAFVAYGRQTVLPPRATRTPALQSAA